MERYVQILFIAIDAVLANKFRSILTALGIIFGVAAVIAMMAIGNGARQEILDQMKSVGVNNIVITPIDDMITSDDDEGKSSSTKFSPGLNLKDAESIRKIIPTVAKVSPQVTYETFILKSGKRSKANLNGVTPEFFQVYTLKLAEGQMFNSEHMKTGAPVCIISPVIKARFFPDENPIGKHIKCGHIWLKVIGVLEGPKYNIETRIDLGVGDYSQNIFAPLSTILLRYKDRSIVNMNKSGGTFRMFGRGSISISSSSSSSSGGNNNQIDKIIVQVKETEQLIPTQEVLRKLLYRRHQEIKDYDIKIPELLLKQEQRTKDIFNIVLGAIASISLIVGGIGIMNIMLASVMERIREIGVRMATGARKLDIVLQFLTEATLISISGGLIGILLGLILSKLIMQTTGILTIISPISIIISFGVSAGVGILFGYMPSKKASEQDPVTSLRHD